MQTLADALEQHLMDEADAVTAKEWMPWARDKQPEIDDLPGHEAILEALLQPFRQAGFTPDLMQRAAQEKRRAEEKALNTRAEWVKDHFSRRFSEGLVEKAWVEVKESLPSMQGAMDVSDYAAHLQVFDQQVSEIGFEHLNEIPRLEDGEPGRN